MENIELKDLMELLPGERSYGDYVNAANALKNLPIETTKNPNLKIAILRNFTVEPLISILECEIYAMGFLPEILICDFDSIVPETLNPKSNLYKFNPDFIIVLNWLETISPILTTRFLSQTKDVVLDEVDRVRQYLQDICKNIRRYSSAPVLMNNFPPPVETTLGVLDSQLPDQHSSTIIHLNQQLILDCKETSDVYLIDFARIFSGIGIYNSIDSRHWHMARAPLTQKALLNIGLETSKIFKALRGKAKKCLVLDCDNTLWGGIVGEDGIEGIKIGSTFPGSGFLALQEEILNLHDRGVILALCSKNNEADVLKVLHEHPEMLIKESHLATWQINWDDKATNIRRIAEELNIGLDSFVFVDDSDFEVNLIREQLPQVTTIHLKGNTSEYRSVLSRGGYFDALTFTAEDRRKNAMYGETRVRKQLESSSSSIEEYLEKLGIEVKVGNPNLIDIPRCSQLTQKTNQFNLTTRRYSEGQIKEFSLSNDSDVYCVRVKDKIADMGLVGVAIVRYEKDEAEIDSFLLSCRAIGRGVETALLSHIAEKAAKIHHVKKIKGKYIATEKNSQVMDFYEKNQFSIIDKSDQESHWFIDLSKNEIEAPKWIRIVEEK